MGITGQRIGALMLALLAAAAETAVVKPNVHLYGALVAEPCVIPPGEENIPLDFGTLIDKYLYLNTRTLGHSFRIHLAQCDISVGKTVKVRFLGMENQVLPGLLAVDAGSQAKGIAIGLEAPRVKGTKPLPVNALSGTYPLQAGDNFIVLKAYVQGEPQALANKTIGRGPFTATATFNLEYE